MFSLKQHSFSIFSLFAHAFIYTLCHPFNGHFRRFMRKPWYFSGFSAHLCPSRRPSKISQSRRDFLLLLLEDLLVVPVEGAVVEVWLLVPALTSTWELDMDTLPSSLPSCKWKTVIITALTLECFHPESEKLPLSLYYSGTLQVFSKSTNIS